MVSTGHCISATNPSGGLTEYFVPVDYRRRAWWSRLGLSRWCCARYIESTGRRVRSSENVYAETRTLRHSAEPHHLGKMRASHHRIHRKSGGHVFEVVFDEHLSNPVRSQLDLVLYVSKSCFIWQRLSDGMQASWARFITTQTTENPKATLVGTETWMLTNS